MNKFGEFLSNVKKGFIAHSPEILVGVGIAGSITSIVLAVRATPKAVKLLEERKAKEKKQKLSTLETVETTWKCYIPAVATEALSVACILGAKAVDAKRNAALAAAYSLMESKFTTYQQKVVEQIGEKKEVAIRDSIATDEMEKNPVTDKTVIITGKGETLCYDTVSGRYFKSDIEKIRRAMGVLNVRLRNEMFISLNEWYDELDLEHIAIGDKLGWNIDNGYIDVIFSSQLAKDETPCLVIDYTIGPRYDVSSNM